jgi:hypothetical protein
MRRGFSIFLILFFGLGPLSALVDGSADAGLPVCCRRHGAHHCALYAQIMAMRAGRGIDPTPGFSAPLTCPAALAGLRPEFARAPAPAFERMAAFSGPSRAYAGRGPPGIKNR